MKSNTTKSDSDIKSDVLAELKYEPRVHVTDIGVLVKDGAVTLNGYAASYGEKGDAVRAAKRVAGVRAIADDIEVKLTDSQRRSDGDIAAAAANQLGWSTMIPTGSIGVTVREGWITLDGEVEWWFRKNAAENAVQDLAGVQGVTNHITIKPALGRVDVEKSIKAAFARSAIVDAKKIHVVINGNNVVLSGKVRNHAEREEAERAAWAAAGVYAVDNKLTVEWPWECAD